MAQTNSSRSGLTRTAVSVLALSLSVADGFSQEGSRSSTKVNFEFGGETSFLRDDAILQRWVARDLHRKLGLASIDVLELTAEPRKLNDTTIYTIKQRANGLPVVRLESRLILDRDRQPIRVLGHHKAFPTTLAARPSVAVNDILRSWTISEDDLRSKRLVYWPNSSRLTLCYELDGAFEDGDSGFERIYVDAHSGDLVERLPLEFRGLDRRIYDFAQACRSERVRSLVSNRRSAALMTTAMRRHLVRHEASSPAGAHSVDQLFGQFGAFHRFLDVMLGMDSFDDADGVMSGIVNIGFHDKRPSPQCIGNQFNAFWSTPLKSAGFSVGAIAFSEMVGHELGHGLIESGSRLIYQGESGALHESIADSIGVAFRAWIETRGNLRAKLPADTWELRSPVGPVRDMSNPRNVRGLPNHYRDYRVLPIKEDQGGVHTNSSIMNQGFYLLAMGGSHPDTPSGLKVSGIGIAKAIEIFARAAFNILTPNSSFTDAREAFAYTAEILHGEESPEWVATHTAMDAIGIPGYWRRPTVPRSDPVTDASQTPENPAEPPSEPDVQLHPDPIPSPVDEPEQGRVPRPEPAPPNVSKQPSPTRSDTKPTPNQDPNPPTIPRDPSPSGPAPRPQPSGNEANDSLPIPTIVAAVLLLLSAAFAIVKARETRKVANRRAPTNDTRARTNQNHHTQQTATKNSGVGLPLPQSPAQTAGSLVSLDGSKAIPLPLALLRSSEGLVIGRAMELCHIRISDHDVSRRHLRCRFGRGRIWIEDLNSTRGTEVDGERLKAFHRTEVLHGQFVRIGKDTYVLSTSDTEKVRID